MEVTALCIELLMIVMILLCEHNKKVNAVSLRIDPNRAQFFEYEPVTFYCEDLSYCEVVHESTGKINISNTNNKRTSTGSSCTIQTLYAADSGAYWCNAGGGKRSNNVKIAVTAGSVILEIPALPVMEGEAVTLSCRNKKTSSQTSAHFYKDGVFISNSSTGNMNINSVSKSDEGLYKCSISGAGESAESWLSVRDDNRCKCTTSSDSTPWIIVTVLLACLLVVVGLLQFVKCYRKRGASAGGANTHAFVTDNRDNKEPSISAPFAVTDSSLTEDMLYSTIP